MSPDLSREELSIGQILIYSIQYTCSKELCGQVWKESLERGDNSKVCD